MPAVYFIMEGRESMITIIIIGFERHMACFRGYRISPRGFMSRIKRLHVEYKTSDVLGVVLFCPGCQFALSQGPGAGGSDGDQSCVLFQGAYYTVQYYMGTLAQLRRTSTPGSACSLLIKRPVVKEEADCSL
jgi:hypothetical protein